MGIFRFLKNRELQIREIQGRELQGLPVLVMKLQDQSCNEAPAIEFVLKVWLSNAFNIQLSLNELLTKHHFALTVTTFLESWDNVYSNPFIVNGRML